jgi:hypothetical protein
LALSTLTGKNWQSLKKNTFCFERNYLSALIIWLAKLVNIKIRFFLLIAKGTCIAQKIFRWKEATSFVDPCSLNLLL